MLAPSQIYSLVLLPILSGQSQFSKMKMIILLYLDFAVSMNCLCMLFNKIEVLFYVLFTANTYIHLSAITRTTSALKFQSFIIKSAAPSHWSCMQITCKVDALYKQY